jgi:predicted dehydrogenase
MHRLLQASFGRVVRRRWPWPLLVLLCVVLASPEAYAQAAPARFRLAIVGLTHGHSFIAFRTLTANADVEVLASYPDHRVGIIEASWDLPRNIQQLEVFGDRGSVDLVSNSGSQLVRFETWEGRERREVPLATPAAHWADPATYFAHVVRRGHVDEFVSADFHADVMAILEAAQRSADTGQPVAVSSVTGR